MKTHILSLLKTAASKTRLLLFGLSAFMASSCQNVLDINRDPDEAPEASVDLVLPVAQFQLASTLGNTWNFIGSMWGEYWTGGYGVSTSNLEYWNMTSTNVENSWTRAYARTLGDIKYLTESGQPVYSGMGKIMAAYLFQMLVDLHGDVPFSEALQGAIEDGSIYTPKFDDEQEIYAALQTMLMEGITEIKQTGGLIEIPGSDDLVYQGDIVKWERFANTIRLKLYVRSGNTTAALNLMNEPGISFIGAGDDATMRFFETTKNTNPLYAFFESNTSVGMYYNASTASIDYLLSTGDPRIDRIYNPGTFGHAGVDNGDINANTTKYPAPATTAAAARAEYSSPNTTYVFGPTIPVFFISEWESYFLQAEVLMRSGADATAMFEKAVQASFDYYDLGADAPAYFATIGFDPSDPIDDQLDILAKEKWVAMNGLQMAEGWLETLRFDRPGHHIFTDPVNGIFTSPINNALGANNYPSSFVYPTQEVSLNPSTPSRTVTDHRFWDN